MGRGKAEGQYRGRGVRKIIKIIHFIMYKISYKDILYNTRNIANII